MRFDEMIISYIIQKQKNRNTLFLPNYRTRYAQVFHEKTLDQRYRRNQLGASDISS